MSTLMVDYNMIGKAVSGSDFTLALFSSEAASLHVGDIVRIVGDSTDDKQAVVTKLPSNGPEATLRFL